MCSLFVHASESPIVFEAENFNVEYAQGFKKESDNLASGGYCLRSTKNNTSQIPSANEDGYLEYSFTVGKSGYYNIWIRSKSADSGSDSVYYRSVTGTNYIYKDFPISDTYQWTKIEKAYLNSGTYKIRFISRESAGFRLDKILVTDIGYYIPSGISGESAGINQKLPDVYGKPAVYPPKNEHPRVLVRKGEQLEEIVRNLSHQQNLSMYNKVLSYAGENLNGILKNNNDNYDIKQLAVAESCAFLYLIDGKQKTTTADFTDIDKVSDYAKGGVVMLANSGIISGYEDGTFGPNNDVTRAEAATVLARALEFFGI